MSARKHVTLSMPVELVESLDISARDRCVGRNLLIEMLLTQGLRRLMPADSFLFGVEIGEIADDRPASFPFVEVEGVEWCYAHDAEFVEGNPECGMGDQSELPCHTIPLFYRAGDS